MSFDGSTLEYRSLDELGRALSVQHDTIRMAMQDPKLPRAFETAGSPPRYLDAPDFARFSAQDSARLVRAVERFGRVE